MGVPVTTIRPMTVEDLEHVVDLESAEQPKPWSERMFRQELETENRIYLVAENDRIVGYAGVMVVGDEAHVTNLLVTERFRNNGVGRRLMETLIESAVDRGAEHLTLEVRASNARARRLYAGLGLAPVGIRPNYYGDEDALIMWAHDIASPSGERHEEPNEETVG